MLTIFLYDNISKCYQFKQVFKTLFLADIIDQVHNANSLNFQGTKGVQYVGAIIQGKLTYIS